MKPAYSAATSPAHLALAVLTFLGYGVAQQPDLRDGQALWRSCAACHCVPDQRISEDQNWLRLNKTTTCISGENNTPAGRANLIAYLKAEKTLRPLLIDENYEPSAGTVSGKIQMPSAAGSAYLKADRQSIRKGSPPKIRLVWQASKNGTKLTLPAGTYRVITYNFYRTDAKKQSWSIAGTSAEGCLELTIDSAKPETFDLHPEVQGHLSAKQDQEKWKLGFFMTNRVGDRMSISRDGKLVNPKWSIRGAEKRVIDHGDFEVT